MHFNRALMYTDVLKKPLVSVLQLMMGAQDSTDLDLHIAPRKIFMTGRGNIQEYKRRKAEVLGSSVAVIWFSSQFLAVAAGKWARWGWRAGCRACLCSTGTHRPRQRGTIQGVAYK